MGIDPNAATRYCDYDCGCFRPGKTPYWAIVRCDGVQYFGFGTVNMPNGQWRIQQVAANLWGGSKGGYIWSVGMDESGADLYVTTLGGTEVFYGWTPTRCSKFVQSDHLGPPWIYRFGWATWSFSDKLPSTEPPEEPLSYQPGTLQNSMTMLALPVQHGIFAEQFATARGKLQRFARRRDGTCIYLKTSDDSD